MIRFRMLMTGARYEDGSDAATARLDIKSSLEGSPSDEQLCSQSTTQLVGFTTACLVEFVDLGMSPLCLGKLRGGASR
jgi:hypothetical protein